MIKHLACGYCLIQTAAFLLSGFISTRCAAQVGTLAEPFPAPAPNAALHYQRALLHLANLGDVPTLIGSRRPDANPPA